MTRNISPRGDRVLLDEMPLYHFPDNSDPIRLDGALVWGEASIDELGRVDCITLAAAGHDRPWVVPHNTPAFQAIARSVELHYAEDVDEICRRHRYPNISRACSFGERQPEPA